MPDSYRKVIDHVHFSPRILADLLSRPLDTHGGSAVDQVVAALSDPMGLWNHVFENQLSNEDRSVLVALFTWGGSVDAEVLERSVRSEMTSGSVSFRRCIRVLNGTFLVTGRGPQSKKIEFLNPSVSDFMLRRVSADDGLLSEALDHVKYFEQLIGLWRSYETDRKSPTQRLDLRAVANRIEDLALSTIDAPGVAPLDPVSKLAICLAMANELRLPRLADRVAASLGRQGVVYRAADPEDICALIESTDKSWHEGVRRLHKPVLLEGGTSLFNRDKSEEGALRAEYYARRIRRYVDDRTFQELQSSAISFVDWLCSEYEDGEIVDYDVLYLVADFVKQFSDVQRRWPAIPSMLEDLPPTPEEQEELDLEIADLDPEYYDGDVYLTMNALLEGE